ncbi:hypothetical protein ACFL4A_00730 [bacterium]
MEYIAHRINTIEELKKIPFKYGVEIDIRDYGNELILNHDPFQAGESFEDYLKHYRHGTMILNIKSERVEHKVLELVKKYNILKYFFLDSSFPMIHFLSTKGEKNIAVRFSEYEGLDTVLAMEGRIKWIWVDCFTKLPINKDNYSVFQKAGFKLCLVSPELQNRDEDIEIYKKYLVDNNIKIDAVCSKIYNVGRWL